jgi:4-hydroxy-3-polyprenylbenzoate decarboxylase
MGKIIIVVDDDINPSDLDQVLWAVSFRMQPHRDVLIVPGEEVALDPSAGPPDAEIPSGHVSLPTSAMLLDATRKWDYPPVSLPARQFMERAKEIWEEEGFPELKPKPPWYGYSLGNWPKKLQEEAELALKGDHFQTGKKLAEEERTDL